MKKIISIVLFAVWCGGVLSGQEIKRPESYNYWRGQEALQIDDVAGALDLFEKGCSRQSEKRLFVFMVGISMV